MSLQSSLKAETASISLLCSDTFELLGLLGFPFLLSFSAPEPSTWSEAGIASISLLCPDPLELLCLLRFPSLLSFFCTGSWEIALKYYPIHIRRSDIMNLTFRLEAIAFLHRIPKCPSQGGQ